MSWQARGLYRELLDEYWKEGVLRDDHSYMAEEVCGCSIEEFEEFWPEISPHWYETEDGLANAKMEEQRTEKDKLRLANAKNGSAGAIAKMANAKQSPSERQAHTSERHIEEREEREESQPKSGNTLPHFIPYETWESFKKMRKQIKKPMTPAAEKLLFGKIQRAYDSGLDALWSVNNSLVNCWQDVYTDKAPKRVIEYREATAADDIWADIGAASA